MVVQEIKAVIHTFAFLSFVGAMYCFFTAFKVFNSPTDLLGAIDSLRTSMTPLIGAFMLIQIAIFCEVVTLNIKDSED